MPINNYLIIGVNPANNETTVPLDKRISVTFSKGMDQTTLSSSSLVLQKVNGDIVPYDFSYSHEIMTARLQPKANFEPGTQYQLQVVGGTDGVKSITGDYMGVSRSYEFTTKHTTALSAPTSFSHEVDSGYVSLSWQRPSDYDNALSLHYEVRITTSNDAEAAIVWPAAGDMNQTNQTLMNVPKKFSEGNHYAYVRALNGPETSGWTQTQFYVEAPQTTPTTPPVSDGSGGGNLFSFDVADTYPRTDSVDVTPQQLMLIFSSNLDKTSVTPETVYVVKRPHKKNLSLIDFMTDYAPSQAVASTIEPILVGNMLTVTATLEDDAEYTAIVRETVKSETGDALGIAYTWGFATKYTQLYGDPSLIRRDIGTLSDSISDKLLYSYLKEASDYAYQVVSGTAAFNATDYADGNAPYYVHQYARLRASYDLIMNAQMRSGGGGTTTNISLGDLSVEKDASTGGSVSGTLSGIKQQMKHYLDLMHGHNNRGYAKPSVVVRGETGAAYPDFLTRTEFKELGQ